MRFLMTNWLLLFTLTCTAQRVSIKIPVFAFIDEFSFPTIQTGIEVGITKKISWYNEAGIKYRKSSYMWADTSFIDSRGCKLKSEFRYYKSTVLNGGYVGLNGFYTKDFHHNWTAYYHAGDSSDVRIDNFSVKKVVSGLNLIAGKIYPTRKKISTEIFAGLGIRFVTIVQNNTEFDQQRDNPHRGNGCFTIADVAYWKDVEGGKFVSPNFSFGIRFSYSLK